MKTATAYVDGSYDSETQEFSCGVVMFVDDKTETASKKFTGHPAADMRNVAGEIAGAMLAMEYARQNQIDEITIYHDYIGIAAWCTGAWKTKKEYTKKYREFFTDISKSVKVNFVKVTGHSGDKFNDLADKLAKEALGK
jgi:Ribonuclease HI